MCSQQKNSTKKKPMRKYSLITAFLFPVLVCCIGFALIKVYPFGSRSALIINGVHQYLGFYKELQHQISQGISWTFSGHAMGYNFYSLFCYYLTSPFNLLILLLMQFLYVNEAVTLVVLLKIGLTGLCMAWYVQQRLPEQEWPAAGIGCMYALSNYVLGYYSNLMWLDCVMLLPVLAWAVEQLVIAGRWRVYTAVLGYCILSNYYMGFMLCVFAALCYPAVYFGTEKRRDGWWKSCVRFAGASVLSGGISAVVLIPAVSAVAKTTAARQAGLSGAEGVYGDLWEQLGRLLFDSFPYATSSNQAAVNLYCGCAALVFAAMFFLNRRIRWQRKAALAALLIFYFAGFHFQALNLVLHGMHKPVGMPNRFGFIFIFLLLEAAADGWGQVKDIAKSELAAGAVLCILFCAAIGIRTRDPKALGAAVIVLAYFYLLAERTEQTKKRYFLLNIFLLLEIGLHGIFGICGNGTANRNLYKASGEEMRKIMMSAGEDRTDSRTVIVNPVLRNEELLYGLNGVSMFSSTNTDAMQLWMERMGFETGQNRFQYAGATELMDILLGIKNVVCRDTISLSTSYAKTYDGRYFDLYENPRVLAGGYVVDSSIQDFRLDGRNPLEIQNSLLRQMGAGELFRTEQAASAVTQSGPAEAIFEIRLNGGEHGYLWIPGTEADTVEIDGRIQKRNDWNNRFLDLGYSDQDRIVQVKISKDSIDGAVLGTCSRQRLEEIYQKLSKSEIRIEKGTGTVHAAKDGILFFGTFYDEGLHVQIDGQEVKTLNLEGMLGVKVEKGDHTVKIGYETPGLKSGTAVSVLCMGIFLAGPVKEYLGQHRKKTAGKSFGERRK